MTTKPAQRLLTRLMFSAQPVVETTSGHAAQGAEAPAAAPACHYRLGAWEAGASFSAAAILRQARLRLMSENG